MSAVTADLPIFIPSSFFFVLGTPSLTSFLPCKFGLIIHFSSQSLVLFFTISFIIFFHPYFSPPTIFHFSYTSPSPIPLLKLNTVLAFKALNAFCLPAATTSVQFSPKALNREWSDQLVPSGTWQERTVSCLFCPWL